MLSTKGKVSLLFAHFQNYFEKEKRKNYLTLDHVISHVKPRYLEYDFSIYINFSFHFQIEILYVL